MTQIVGLPLNDAERLGRQRLTQQQLFQAKSIDNMYRLALGRIRMQPTMSVRFGKSERTFPSTDLMLTLRKCMENLSAGRFPLSDFDFFRQLLSRFRTNGAELSAAEFLYLRRIARGELPEYVPQDPEEILMRRKLNKLRQLLGGAKGRAARARNRKPHSARQGCTYHDPLTGVRCGSACEEGNLCDTHKNFVPPLNGHGTLFYALSVRESNFHRR